MMMYLIPFSLLISGSIFPIGAVIYYVTTNFFSLGQQFYVLRKFPPPPVTATTGPSFGSIFAERKAAAQNGAAQKKNGVPAKTTGKNAVKPGAKMTTPKNGTPTTEVRAVAPKVGAKPVNPKKGSNKR
jgi:YidC/Oxa1 family membrane protein insertase